MFDAKHYGRALSAFFKAGEDREVAICNACLLREKARSIPTIANTNRIQAFIAAANAFTTCARNSPPEQVDECRTYYRTAGDCYSEARDLKNAGDSYRMAGQYAAAILAYREGGYSDELVEVTTQHSEKQESRAEGKETEKPRSRAKRKRGKKQRRRAKGQEAENQESRTEGKEVKKHENRAEGKEVEKHESRADREEAENPALVFDREDSLSQWAMGPFLPWGVPGLWFG